MNLEGYSSAKKPSGLERYYCNQHGFILVLLQISIVIIGIALSVAARSWVMIDRREKETELLFRGNAIKTAIEQYYKTPHGGKNRYPNRLEDLLYDDTGLNPKRYLRKLYKDPITGGQWNLIKEREAIRGVRSRSDLKPVKQAGFPQEYKEFEGKTRYSAWSFEYIPKNKKRVAEQR